MEKSNLQYMEPEVSLIKFKEEISNFHKISNDWREKGVFLIHEDYPVVEFMFTTPKLRPSRERILPFAQFLSISGPVPQFS